MLRLSGIVSGLCLALAVNANAASSSPTSTVSYAMGYKTGQALKAQSIDVDTNGFNDGLQAGYLGKKPAISDQEMQKSLNDMQEQMVQKMQTKNLKEAEKNEKAGEAFLANNAKVADVKTTASGLQYQVINAGDGENPTPTDTVTVNYEGKLINGKIFDSSYQRGKPVSFKVNEVIPGWQEALVMMKPGATWMLYIPSKLAYGKQGSMGAIGPNEVLIFKVELVSVKQ